MKVDGRAVGLKKECMEMGIASSFRSTAHTCRWSARGTTDYVRRYLINLSGTFLPKTCSGGPLSLTGNSCDVGLTAGCRCPIRTLQRREGAQSPPNHQQLETPFCLTPSSPYPLLDGLNRHSEMLLLVAFWLLAAAAFAANQTCTSPTCIAFAQQIRNNLTANFKSTDPCTDFDTYAYQAWVDTDG
jgi:hypothetical protein